jgi:hypothetical protein
MALYIFAGALLLIMLAASVVVACVLIRRRGTVDLSSEPSAVWIYSGTSPTATGSPTTDPSDANWLGAVTNSVRQWSTDVVSNHSGLWTDHAEEARLMGRAGSGAERNEP